MVVIITAYRVVGSSHGASCLDDRPRFRDTFGRVQRLTARPAAVEALVLTALYCAYSAARGVADGAAAEAVARGWVLLNLSARLGIDVELDLNRWLHGVPVLALACCYYYATTHFMVTPAVLVWMHRRHPASYEHARSTLALATVIALAGFFVFPTAPPRLLPGAAYVDTMADLAAWGWWDTHSSAAPVALSGLANHYAALPSLHCVWALWCALAVMRHATSPVVRMLAVLYPLATAFVVTATANHYLVDALAGWAVLGAAVLAAAALARVDVRGRALVAENPCGAIRLPSSSRSRS
jgi:hypothetical protein